MFLIGLAIGCAEARGIREGTGGGDPEEEVDMVEEVEMIPKSESSAEAGGESAAKVAYESMRQWVMAGASYLHIVQA